ncbi:hypothetical protein JYU34_003589 [Plutella xylostella]|nr:hypothetical protein JYU34_014625 [Plutella xylostella]KAG7310775.1 hypothetical protein JYU34_003589 [Plutella xylostella]
MKNYYYPSPSDDEILSPSLLLKKPTKRIHENIDSYFETPSKKSKSKTLSSTVGRAACGGISYISTNEDDGSKASHLIKIEMYDMKKLKDLPPSEHWKKADMRIKLYCTSDHILFHDTNQLMFSITKQIATKTDCKKYFLETSK